MKKTILGVLALLSMTNLSHAYAANPWTMDAAFGGANYFGIGSDKDQTGVARLSLGHAFITTPIWQAGFETGIQSGATLHLNLPQELIEELGGVPIDGEMKPSLDLLASLKSKPWLGLPIMTWVKGGISYRKLQANHSGVNDLSGFSPEIQVGLGYQINSQVTINIGYQHIWGKKPELTVDPETATGHLCNFPKQQALLIGISFNFW